MVLLLSIMSISLMADSIQSAYADHTEPGTGIFKDEEMVTLIVTTNTEYLVYLQIQVRNGDDQLISVTESTATGAFIDHELTDLLHGQKQSHSQSAITETFIFLFETDLMHIRHIR